jgi:hypothetical protein
MAAVVKGKNEIYVVTFFHIAKYMCCFLLVCRFIDVFVVKTEKRKKIFFRLKM